VTDATSPHHPAIRASDAERQQTILVLRDALLEGRLTLDEYSDRTGHALAARTDHDLAELTRDLPARSGSAAPVSSPRPPAAAEHRAFCSHLVRRGPMRLDEHTVFLSLCGTIDLDLRQARLPGPEVDLTIRNIFGTVRVIVPDGVDVRVDGGGWWASQYIDTPSTLLPEAPIIRIHASGPGGSLYVRVDAASESR
jgi:hypothetical protein